MKSRAAAITIALLSCANCATAQKVPEAGYIFPAGGKAGSTVEVQIGGYDWTPDMEFFVHDRRIKLTPSGPLGSILIPGPPYWFGAKGRLTALPLPREMPAQITIPADVGPGPVYWQAANANGCTSSGIFMVGNGPEVIEDERRKGPQSLHSIPVTVSGRIAKIEEVDRYRFVAPNDGPITVELFARRLGAKFLGILEVRDQSDRMLSDVAGTNGRDPSLTFVAKAGAEYSVSVRDIDFGGDRSYVYRLAIRPGPRVIGAIPAIGRHGEAREVEFVGHGLATGAAKLESVKRRVSFPNDGTTYTYPLETPWGSTSFSMPLSDLPEIVTGSAESAPGDSRRAGPAWLTEAAAVTGVFDQSDVEDRYYCAWKKGEVWSLAAEARRFGSPLDLSIAVLGLDGKELARNDDLPDTTDAGLEFTVPADGTYQIVVSDSSGKGGSRAAIYRLAVQHPETDFELHLASQRVGVPIDGRGSLAVKAIRKGGFKGSIALHMNGLPEGVNVHPTLVIPADKSDLVISLHGDRLAGTAASLVSIEGRAEVAAPTGKPRIITRTAMAHAAGNLAPGSPTDGRVSEVLVATTMKARFKGHPVDSDTVRKVHRGSTFPAEVIVERLEGFQGEIVLQMAAQQSYQVQGITGDDVMVPPGVGKVLYPCFMPEWLETSRTSRMGVIGVAKLADPTGKVRIITGEITGFITMTLEGALLKVSAEEHELAVPAGEPFDVRVKISRLTKLSEQVRLELRLPEELTGQLKADAVVVPVGQETAVFRVTPAAKLQGLQTFQIRATAMQDGKYPAVSEAGVSVEFGLPPAAPKR